MLQLQTGIILIFALIVIVYILANQKNIDKIDLALLVVSVVALTWKYFTHTHTYESTTSMEHFEEEQQSLEGLLSTLKPITEEEDISKIIDGMVMYFTSFNKISYTPETKVWRNLVDTTKTTDGKLECSSAMTFDLLPSFGRPQGFALGSNKLTGPLSNTLKINYRNPYTMMLVFKHGNLKNDATASNKIELLKLWANSPNNNGASLYIEPGSLQLINNTQFGKLMFQYADYAPVHCRINKVDELISIENNMLCFIFIVKYDDKVRIVYMTEKNNALHVLSEFNIANSDITFSNKELIINRFKNWPAHIYNFAIFKKPLTDANISTIYSHIKALYSRYNDPSLPNMVDKYNSTITALQKMLQCPFDKKTCETCKDVTQWSDITQLISAPLACRKAISKQCKSNPQIPLCQCWDKKSSVYGTSACKLLQTIFETNDATCYTSGELEKLKKKNAGKCAVAKETTVEKKLDYDSEYTFDKVRVKYGDSFMTTKEKQELGLNVSRPSTMTVNDYQAQLAAKSTTSTPIKTTSGPSSTQSPSSSSGSKEVPKPSNLEKESNALIQEVDVVDKQATTTKNTSSIWSIAGMLGF